MAYHQTARSEKLRAASRAKILKAARRLFGRQGYQATTMREIAKTGGTSIGNVYFYFKNKEELLSTLVSEALQTSWAAADAAAAEAPQGATRLAVLQAANVDLVLSTDRDLAGLVLVMQEHLGLRETARKAAAARWKSYLLENLPLDPTRDLDLAVTAWTGAGFTVGERTLRGELPEDREGHAAFLTRWNLSALGLPSDEIEGAIAYALERMREWEAARGR